jgi:hypothetical protein
MVDALHRVAVIQEGLVKPLEWNVVTQDRIVDAVGRAAVPSELFIVATDRFTVALDPITVAW